MRSMFADYKFEREGKILLETEHGFAIYMIQANTCYLEDIYIAPDFRKQGHGAKLADMVCAAAKGLGCKTLLGSVVPSAKGSTESLKAFLAYGMRLQSSRDNFIWLEKEIQ